MPREIGDTILAAAGGIVQQLQNQDQLRLQMQQFGERVKAAEESVRLREQNLQLEQQKVAAMTEQNQLQADMQLRRLEIAEDDNARKNQLQPFLENAQAALAKRRSLEATKLEQDIKGVSTGAIPIDNVSRRLMFNTVIDSLPGHIDANPGQFIKNTTLSPDQLRSFSRVGVDQLRKSFQETEVAIGGLQRAATVDPASRQKLDALTQLNEQRAQYIGAHEQARSRVLRGDEPDAMTNIVSGALEIDATIVKQAQRALAANKVNEGSFEPEQLYDAFINPEIDDPKAVNQLQGILKFPAKTPEDVELAAATLDSLMAPTATRAELNLLAESFNRLGQSQVRGFDLSNYTAIWAKVLEKRGFRKRSER